MNGCSCRFQFVRIVRIEAADRIRLVVRGPGRPVIHQEGDPRSGVRRQQAIEQDLVTQGYRLLPFDRRSGHDRRAVIREATDRRRPAGRRRPRGRIIRPLPPSAEDLHAAYIPAGRTSPAVAPGCADVHRRRAGGPGPPARRRMDDLRRRPGQPALLGRSIRSTGTTSTSSRWPGASRPTPRPAAGVQLPGDAADGQRRALLDRRHAPRGGRARCRHRRDAVDAQPQRRGQARRSRAAQLSGRGLAYWTDGKRGADRLRDARLPDDRARREDRACRFPAFGKNGIVDLKLEMDQPIDLETGEIGLHARRSSPAT